MKTKILSLFIFIFIGTFIISGCKKKDKASNNNTQLKFIVIRFTSTGTTKAVDARVELFNTQSDKNVDQNSIATLRTDANGEALFSNLKQQVYYYYILYTATAVNYNCTNDKTNGALVPNTVNTITEELCQ